MPSTVCGLSLRGLLGESFDMPQKGRKTSIVVSFLCPVTLLQRVDEALAEQQQNTLAAPLAGRSEWIRRAIERDLDHRERSRRKRSNNQHLPPITVCSDNNK